ncbi:putative ribonuclease H-like domain-containing protein [Tanacetum coccineum]
MINLSMRSLRIANIVPCDAYEKWGESGFNGFGSMLQVRLPSVCEIIGADRCVKSKLVEERRARLELVEVIDGMRRKRAGARGGAVGLYKNGLPRMGRVEMLDQARFAWGFLSVLLDPICLATNLNWLEKDLLSWDLQVVLELCRGETFEDVEIHFKQQFEGFSVSNSEGLHKGYDRFQSLLSQLKIHGTGVSTEDANQKFLRSLPSSWSQGVSTSSDPATKENHSSYTDRDGLEMAISSRTISMRLKNFYKKTGRRLQFDAKEPVGFDKTKVECYNCHNTGHFARECRSKGNQDSRRRNAGNTGYRAKDNGRRPGKQEESKALINLDGEGVVIWTGSAEDKQRNFVFGGFLPAIEGSAHEALHASSPPMTGNYIPFRPNRSRSPILVLGRKETLESVLEPVELNPKLLDNLVWSDALSLRINTARTSGTNTVNTARHNFNRLAVPTNAARKVNTVKPIVNNARPKVGFHKTLSPFRKPFNGTTTLRTNFSYQKVNTAKVNAVSAVGEKRETAVKPSAGCNWRHKRHYWNKVSKYNGGSSSRNCVPFKDPLGRPKPKKAWVPKRNQSLLFNVQDYPQRALQNKGIVDSGCSRHMTGNKAYLAGYQDFNGGPVAFGGSKGYITGKGKIKTRKIDFEDVCFVKELQYFNLFSVSQMCDKKNKVLFTDTECLVLSPEFKLPDENQVLLRIPRQNNMYSFNLENIVPSGGLACLIAKATIDESNKWHRRLGHVNFKNLNKLVKGNLVRGLPSKIFQNDHTCVACQKRKQHNASCKAKSVSSISQPLQLLHMDLFRPTSVRSLNNKTYCLVITDDFSRSKGIKREYSNAKTPQQNRVAERKNRTLIEAARTMLADSFLPNTFWAKARYSFLLMATVPADYVPAGHVLISANRYRIC